MVIILMPINGYFIGGYWWLLMTVILNGYWCMLVIIDGYFIGDYWWLFYW
jgi:hypothetical protein